jgi:Aspartate racemase
VLHLIRLSAQAALDHPYAPRRIGLLSTSGSYQTGIYQRHLEALGLEPVVLDFERHHAWVHDAIYNPEHGLKSVPQAHPEAIIQLNTAIAALQSLGAECIMLGCTEIGMVESELDFLGMASVNPNQVMARALVHSFAPEKLKP